jgi:aspartate dehydrogenase
VAEQQTGAVTFGLVGYGAVGRAVARMIAEGAAGPVSCVGVIVGHPDRYAADAAVLGAPFTAVTEDLIALRPRVVLEAGGHAAFRQHVPVLLAAGIDVISISVGALADPALLEETRAAAVRGGGRLRVPSGAIAALDAISAASVARIDRVVHTVRKPPPTLLDGAEAQAVLASGLERILYHGPAREATQRFPANVNVVAAVSLAGIGMDRTEARVIADPAVVHNTHDVEVEGEFGRLRLRIENVPSDENPRTGRIVALSLVRSLRALTEPIVVGG